MMEELVTFSDQHHCQSHMTEAKLLFETHLILQFKKKDSIFTMYVKSRVTNVDI